MPQPLPTFAKPAQSRQNRAMNTLHSLSSIASSGLQAAQLRSGAAAHNTANLQTPQFQRQSVVQQAQPGGATVASVQTARSSGPSLEADVVEQMAATYSFKANLQTLRTADQMLGALLDVRA